MEINNKLKYSVLTIAVLTSLGLVSDYKITDAMEKENRNIIVDGKIDYFPWDAVNQMDTTKKVLLVDGTLLRTKETGIYLLEGGKKYPFISPEVFDTYNYKYDNVQVIDDKTFNRIPTAQAMPVRSGELIKTSNNPDVYVIENGKKRHITSPVIFEDAKYKWENIRIVSQVVMDIHPMGDKFEDPKYIVDGSVFTQFNNGVVTVKENGKLRNVPDVATFLTHYKSWDIVRNLGTDVTFKTYGLENGGLLKLLDRTLVADSNKVYLVENEFKRAFASPEQFLKYGFKFSDIVQVQNKRVVEDMNDSRPISDGYFTYHIYNGEGGEVKAFYLDK